MTDHLPLMPKATAVWLVEHTALTFRQIADFCGMHELEVAGIADGEVAVGIKGLDPVLNSQLTPEEIRRCEANPLARLRLRTRNIAPPPKKKAPRYIPVSKRQERPQAIAWLVRNHPELENSQIAKLVGSTKPTIEAIRTRTHWNSANIQPVDPVALGLCSQIELDEVVARAAEKKGKRPGAEPADKIGLMSTEESLRAPAGATAARSRLAGFSLDDPRGGGAEEEERYREPSVLDPDALFNLPRGGGSDD